ncbi:hypothetical protein LX64_02208 [Chitinophaga skermanii]|uniref:DUF3990 domain-containing protein n=1 Tax=Chitinophaga skermanii TaxID=331697 RepID=A0A327QMY2_9BACT|nr:hypothetical protein [Chitinophaga skermanii]RAJ05054.1 hypothetical protein LX64_02208 [Chitinophaga skermanii]
MYSKRSGLVLGFHGCDEQVAHAIILGKEKLLPSKNDDDWLGYGIYFWDNSPSRALEYATYLSKRPGLKNSITKPTVLGAVIDLGNCLDLLDYENLSHVKNAYELIYGNYEDDNLSIPINSPLQNGDDLILRRLDCAVIEGVHRIRNDENSPSFDSVRGVCWEGDELYPNAGFREKDHIQICIRNHDCIKGYFLPTVDKYSIVI